MISIVEHEMRISLVSSTGTHILPHETAIKPNIFRYYILLYQNYLLLLVII